MYHYLHFGCLVVEYLVLGEIRLFVKVDFRDQHKNTNGIIIISLYIWRYQYLFFSPNIRLILEFVLIYQLIGSALLVFFSFEQIGISDHFSQFWVEIEREEFVLLRVVYESRGYRRGYKELLSFNWLYWYIVSHI